MSVKAVVEWAPRETNKEADSLANGDTGQFDPNLRVHTDLAKLHCYILLHALLTGRQAEQAALPTPTEYDRKSFERRNTGCM